MMALTLTFTLGSWLVPLSVTVIGSAIAALIIWRESTQRHGDYSIPLMSVLACVAVVAASAVAWGVWLAMRIWS